MIPKIDAVIPYVNCSDESWLAKYKEATGHDIGIDTQNGIIRYHDSGTIYPCIQSIKKYCSWVNDIYLIVADESQVPEFLTDDVKVIFHKDFIPLSYLPCFNSSCIEVFLPFLPNVSERFVYFNDDIILTSDIDVHVFFDNNYNPKTSCSIVNCSDYMHDNMLSLNAYNLIMGTQQQIKELHTIHAPAAFSKTWIKECFNKYKDTLMANLSPNARTNDDYNQYVYQCYQMIEKHCIYEAFTWKSFGKHIKDYQDFDWRRLPEYKGICMNDCLDGDISKYVNIVSMYINDIPIVQLDIEDYAIDSDDIEEDMFLNDENNGYDNL